MTHVTIRPATREDCFYFAPRLRKADLDELYAAGGDDPLESLLDCLGESDTAHVAEHKGIPVCIFGIAQLSPGIGSPWCLGTPQLERIPKSLTQVSAHTLNLYHSIYPVLTQFVSLHHSHSIQWLSRMGFSMLDVIAEFGPRRQPFIVMTRSKPCAIGGFQ